MKPLHALASGMLLLLVVGFIALRALLTNSAMGDVDLGAVVFTAVAVWFGLAFALGERGDEHRETA